MTWIIGATAASIVAALSIFAVCDYLEHCWLSEGWREDEMDDWDSWKPEGKE
jgi:hypothetical protein